MNGYVDADDMCCTATTHECARNCAMPTPSAFSRRTSPCFTNSAYEGSAETLRGVTVASKGLRHGETMRTANIYGTMRTSHCHIAVSAHRFQVDVETETCATAAVAAWEAEAEVADEAEAEAAKVHARAAAAAHAHAAAAARDV